MEDGLTLIHGHSHTYHYVLQALLFNVSRSSSLVTRSSLLLVNTSPWLAAQSWLLLRFLALFPHANKSLVPLASNTGGHKCNQLVGVAQHHAWWKDKAWVLFMAPDNFLVPTAVALLQESLESAARKGAAFLASPYNRRCESADGCWMTDLFLFRPTAFARGVDAAGLFNVTECPLIPEAMIGRVFAGAHRSHQLAAAFLPPNKASVLHSGDLGEVFRRGESLLAANFSVGQLRYGIQGFAYELRLGTALDKHDNAYRTTQSWLRVRDVAGCRWGEAEEPPPAWFEASLGGKRSSYVAVKQRCWRFLSFTTLVVNASHGGSAGNSSHSDTRDRLNNARLRLPCTCAYRYATLAAAQRACAAHPDCTGVSSDAGVPCVTSAPGAAAAARELTLGECASSLGRHAVDGRSVHKTRSRGQPVVSGLASPSDHGTK